MTVASMPMWSPETRSILRAARAMPRKILPPPTTTPICVPVRATAATSSARSRTRPASSPNDCGPARASPLSLRRIRSYFGTLSSMVADTKKGGRMSAPFVVRLSRGFRLIRKSIADFEARKAGNRDILAQLRDLRLDELIDGRSVVLDERLLVQADLFVELRHTAFHDLRRDVRRLAFINGARELDLLLLFERGRGHVFLADELRIGGCDVHCNIANQFLKIVRASHEIGFAVDFHHHAELRAGMNIGADRSLLRGTRSLLASGRNTALAQYDFRFRQIAFRFVESALALHHSGSGTLPELFYQCC